MTSFIDYEKVAAARAADVAAQCRVLSDQARELCRFLLARIAEDEAVARRAIGKRVDISAIWSDAEVAHQIDRWSSARVLAECEAKRQIVHKAIRYGLDYTGGGEHDDPLITFLECIKLLALPYANHADYREEWKP